VSLVEVILTLSTFIGGLALLYYGAEFLVKGGSKIALMLKVSPLVVGLTIVSLGTSAPELFVSLVAAFNKESHIALGNALGSNIANVGLVLGISAILAPITCSIRAVRYQIPVLFLTTLLFMILAMDGVLTWWNGIILLLGLVVFIIFSVRLSQEETVADLPELEDLKEDTSGEGKKPLRFYLGLLLIGTILLSVGAHLLVESSIEIAGLLDIDTRIVALAIIALGTSLPELAATLMAAHRNESDLGLGNIVGSNIFNLLGILGLACMVNNIQVNEQFVWDIFIMIGFFLFMLPVVVWDGKITRTEGIVLFFFYVVYIILLVMKVI